MPHSNYMRVGMLSAIFAAAAFCSFVAIPVHAQTALGGGNPGTTQTTPLGGGNPGTNGSSATGSDSCGHGDGQTIQNPLKVCSLTALLDLVLKGIVQLGVIALTLAIIWVGFMFVMARGNSEAISKARSALVWTIIGGLILLGAQAIGLVIQSTANTL